MKLWALLFISLAETVWAGPTVTPSTATVFVGGTLQFASTDTVTWAMAPGSTGTISAGGLYTAPYTIPKKNVLAGCPVLPNDHIYNTRVDTLPVHANSASRINGILGGATTYVAFEISFPLNIYSNQTPLYGTTFYYTPTLNGEYPLNDFPYRGVENMATPADYFATDRHILGVNTDTCEFSEIYNVYPQGVDPLCPNCTARSGIKFSGVGYTLPNAATGGSTDAAGLYIQPLAIRYDELKAGSINHALRFTMNNGDIYTGFVWPGTANATPGCTPLSDCFPYGSRLRLKSSFNISGFSPTAQVILTALKQYGMILADGGTTLHIQTMSDVVFDTATAHAINVEIPNVINQFQFEEVDQSSLMISTASGRVNINNPYVTPSNFAEVIATKTSDSSTSTVRISIQPVTVGTKNLPFPPNNGTLSVMAGTPQFQIPYWVNGTTSTSVTCTMSPTIGTLGSSCLYTAPTSQSGISSATVTITPTRDPANAISFPLTIFPSDGIRIDVGGRSGSVQPPYDSFGNYGPDVDGKYWWADPVGNIPPWYARDDVYYPESSWAISVDTGLYYTDYHGNSDGAYAAMVPNGRYILKIGAAWDSNPSQFAQAIDTQGVVVMSSSTFNSNIGTAAYTPKDVQFNVNVTNNQFYFAMRMVESSKFTIVNKWSLIPTASESGVFSGQSEFRGNSVLR